MNECIIFFSCLQIHSSEVISCSWKNSLCHSTSLSYYTPVPWSTESKISKQALNLVVPVYVDGTWGFMTLFSNTKPGHWSVMAKANSSTLSTGLWNAIDTDAVDTARSHAGTLPQLSTVRSAGSRKGPHWVWTVLYLLHTSCYCDTTQILGQFCFF